jgi:hypothetical protein
MSIPALVNSPIFSMSRLFRPAAISSRLFFAATIDAFSLVLSLFGLFAIACSLLLTEGIADFQLPIADSNRSTTQWHLAIGNWKYLVAPVTRLL